MTRFTCHKLARAGLLVLFLTTLALMFGARAAFAQDPDPPPPPDPITQIFQYVIQFPTDSLVETLTQAVQAILTKSIEPLEQVFSATLARWVTASPGVATPTGGLVDGTDVMTPAWNLTSRIAILLWPLTLAVTAVIAAKDVVAARTWGIGDLKQALGTWLTAVILSASSLYWMDLANRFANATTHAILDLSFTGAAGFDPNLLTSILIGSAVIVLGMTGLGLIIAIIVLIMGISILAALIFQFVARFALLYVLVAIAPIVIMLGVMPPLRWFTLTWLRGFVMVLAIGPVNALLLKLVMVLGVRGISNDPITAFVNFMATAGVLSALLTVNYTLIRFVFGAVGQVAQRAVGTVTAAGTLALAAVGGIATAGAVGAAGAAGGTMGGGSSLGGGGAGGLANPRALGAGLETAGTVLARSGGAGRGFGAALWGVGSALKQGNSRNGQNASANAPRSNGGTASPRSNRGSSNGAPSSNATEPPPSNNGPDATSHDADRTANAPGATAEPSSKRMAEREGSHRGEVETSRTPQASSPIQPTSIPTPTPRRADAQPAPAEVSQVRQTGGMSPIGSDNSQASMRHPFQNVQTATRSTVTPDAESLITLLDSPLDERVRPLAEAYAGDANQQVSAVQGTVAALSALEAHHGVPPRTVADSWERTMGTVVQAARGGLPLETMANDAGYRGDVTQFIGARVEAGLEAVQASTRPPLFPRAHDPVSYPWHAQVAPHDLEVGQQIATMLGAPPADAQQFANMYHQIRSPENGGGWNAGVRFRGAVHEVASIEPRRRLGALDARVHTMEQQGGVPASAVRPWRVYMSRRQLRQE